MDDPTKVTYLGTTLLRGQEVRFGIRAQDRGRHMYVIGKTGVGKSTLLESTAIQDIQNDEGVIFLDPHGSSVEVLLQHIPEKRIKDVIYFAPFDIENPIAFNIMEDAGYDKRHLVAGSLMSAFKKIWGADTWSSRMEHILNNTLLALLEYPNTTLLDINRMYASPEFRKMVVGNLKDPQVRSFWFDEFDRYTDRTAQEATPAIQNKIGQFTSNPIVRNIIGQPTSSFDFRSVMDDRKILLVNLSKGRIGDGNASLLGILFTSKIYLAALSRADVPREELETLPPVQFFVDEFQSFATDTFAEILSEARKYKLHLALANQYIAQMPEEVRDAVFGNVGTTISFRVGPLDAALLSQVFGRKVSEEDLTNLEKRQIYISLMIDGTNSPVFLAKTLDMFSAPAETYVDSVCEHSRKAYGTPRKEVEEKVKERLAMFSNENKTKQKKEKNSNGAKRSKDSSAPRQESHTPKQTPKKPKEENKKREQSISQENDKQPKRNRQSKQSKQSKQDEQLKYEEQPHFDRQLQLDRQSQPKEKTSPLRDILASMVHKQESLSFNQTEQRESAFDGSSYGSENVSGMKYMEQIEKEDTAKKEDNSKPEKYIEDEDLHSFDDEWQRPEDILKKIEKNE